MSAAANKLVLYTARICPYAQRAVIALREVGAEYESVEIDLQNKPSWYKDVNPELKVPALNIQGKNIAESLVLVELISDLYPEKNLTPKDPVQRAQTRFVIEYFSSKLVPQFYKLITNNTEEQRKEYKEATEAAYKRLDELLREQSPSGPYFLGDQFSIADIAIAPFAIRLLAVEKALLNGYTSETVKNSPRFSEFLQGITNRTSVKDSYLGDKELLEFLAKRFGLKL